MKQDQLYIKDTGAFLEKFKRVEEINKGAILVTADVVGLLEFLWKYDKFQYKIIPTDDIKMVDFMLKNNIFEFDCKFYQQISGMAIGTKFAPSYPCIFMSIFMLKWNS